MKVIVLLLGIFINAYGAEVDQFTNRHLILPDQSEALNKLANVYIQKAITKTNKRKKCEKGEKRLYKNLKKYFANHMKGKFLKVVMKSGDFKLGYTKTNESVFSNWKFGNGWMLSSGLISDTFSVLMPEVQVGDIRIGIDKFEHMFGQGFLYYQGHYLKGKSLDKILKVGEWKERNILGGRITSTGIIAYADLAANFNGMRFWNHMLQKGEDKLGENLGPYIICEEGKFKQVKNIDFRDYVDHSMDEGINCSTPRTKRGIEKYYASVGALGLSCPVDFHAYENVLLKYKDYSEKIINIKK